MRLLLIDIDGNQHHCYSGQEDKNFEIN